MSYAELCYIFYNIIQHVLKLEWLLLTSSKRIKKSPVGRFSQNGSHMYVTPNKSLNGTLVVDSPFQTLAVDVSSIL